MSTNYNAVTSGAAQGDINEVRRRNVQAYEKANGGHVVKLEAEDKKKLRKVSELRTKIENDKLIPAGTYVCGLP